MTANRLYAGENLGILKSLCSDKSVKGHVRLVYIDPPYATGFAFESATVGAAYHDDQVGADYLPHMYSDANFVIIDDVRTLPQ